jgi:putative iron-dependent peroxidase
MTRTDVLPERRVAALHLLIVGYAASATRNRREHHVASPQPGIFALGTASHAYLELDLLPAAAGDAAVGLVASLREPRTTIGGVNLVAGFRPELWAAVAPDAVPPGLTGFNQTIVGAGGYVLPATQHDVVIWLTGAAYDVIFDLSRAIVMALAGVAQLAYEMVGWPYHRDLDLTGFIDGTENPTLMEATSVALIQDGETGAGSSILLLQQWEHNAISWEALPVASQETIIGRQKVDSIELASPPPTSHVARTDQDEFGKIFRRNIAYGTLLRHGTIFAGFCRDQRVLQSMLESMVGVGGGPSDQLTSVTQPLTGAYYLIPSADRLAALAATDERQTT